MGSRNLLPIIQCEQPVREQPVREQPVERPPEKSAVKKYAYEGTVIKLTQADYDRWREAFWFLPDMEAELDRADEYYAQHPHKQRTWFQRVSNWLAAENEKARLQDYEIYASCDFEGKENWRARHEQAARAYAGRSLQ
jgi:hypothetical protein